MEENVKMIISILDEMYPNAKPELQFSNNFELLIAVMLSAQCMDKRVNEVTKELFKVANSPQKMLKLSQEKLQQIIKPCGLFQEKAKNILSASKTIITSFNGEVPDNIFDLMSLNGVGRKTANVVFSTAFGGDAIAVDTHVFTVSNRLGLANSDSVLEVEKQLMQKIDKNLWSKTHLLLVLFGRYVCKKLSPNCDICKLKSFCKFKEEKK